MYHQIVTIYINQNDQHLLQLYLEVESMEFFQISLTEVSFKESYVMLYIYGTYNAMILW